MVKVFCAVFAVILLGIQPDLHSAEKPLRRFVISVGANDGGKYRTPLRYAVSDAGSFMKVMTSVGKVDDEDAYLLYQPNRGNLLSVMNSLYQKILKNRSSYGKIEFVFYYSGHSDEDGILLSSDKVTYSELKRAIEFIPADVRIAILDSCYSGAFTQTKGGQKKPPFMLDTAYNMKGNAFMTSSSRDEVSQESERIRGSFFTHYLILGLRGAADITQDRKITLNEAYQYAYRETLVKTEKTIGGVQHPNYHIQMTGTGDVVLTDISNSASKLTFGGDTEGKLSVYGKSGFLVAEFTKPYGQDVSLSLDPGEYNVSCVNSDKLIECSVTVGNQPAIISLSNFSPVDREMTAMRGGAQVKKNHTTDKETLLETADIKLSAYAAVQFKYRPPLLWQNDQQLYAGGKACFLINDNFSVGAAGFGLTYDRKRRASAFNAADTTEASSYRYPYINLGYGGVLAEYYLYPKSLFSFSVGVLVGGGALSFTEKKSNNEGLGKKYSRFFVLEPELSAYVNVSEYIRAGVTISYRYSNGVDIYEYKDRDFMGTTYSIVLCAGWF